MQRNEDGGVVISCDFCGTDWDEIKPMIEGHHGSVLCLDCLKAALRDMKAGAEPFSCTLCLQAGIPAETLHWTNPVRPQATACKDCIHQAARAFDRDLDVEWKWQR